jgi:hypothetical protein
MFDDSNLKSDEQTLWLSCVIARSRVFTAGRGISYTTLLCPSCPLAQTFLPILAPNSP